MLSCVSRRQLAALALLSAAVPGCSCGREARFQPSYHPPIENVPDAPWRPVRNPRLASGVHPADTLRLGRTLGDTLSLGFVTALAQAGGYLVVADQFVEPHLAVIEAATGRVVARLGRHGKGPREFDVPYAVDVASQDPPGVWVYDFGNQRFGLLAEDVGGAWRVSEVLGLDVGAQLTEPVWLGAGILSNGLLLDHTLLYLDSAGVPQRRVRGDPPFGPEEMPAPHGRFQLNVNHMVLSPAKDRVALAYQYANRLDLFDASGRRMQSVEGPRAIRVRYGLDPESRRLLFGRESERAYVAVRATAERVFALFCGPCSREEPPTVLHEFRWTGEFEREVALAPGTWAFTVTADGSRLIGSYEEADGTPRIGEWW